MTLADLARACDIPYHQIHTWTRRENSVPNAKSLQKVADKLGVTTTHLLLGDTLPASDSETHSQLLAQLEALTEEELRILLAAAQAMRARPPAAID